MGIFRSHEDRIGILRRAGYVSLLFWAFSLNANSGGEVLDAIHLSYVVWPFVTARLARRALKLGRIKTTYAVSAVCAVPTAIILLYWIVMLLDGVMKA